MIKDATIGKMPTQKHFVGSCYETLYNQILNEIDKNPEFTPHTRGMNCKEITNLSFELTNPMDRLVWNKERNMNYEFAMKFFIWMLNGSSDFSYVASSNKNAEKFAAKTESGLPANFSTAYGPRIVRQLPAMIDELNRDPGSRRAVLHILEEGDQAMFGKETKEEYPCTDSLTFLIRDNKLHLHVRMRSNNMVLTVAYDVYNFTMLQEYVYRLLKKTMPALELGTLYQSIASAHFFEKEQALVTKILDCKEIAMPMKLEPAKAA